MQQQLIPFAFEEHLVRVVSRDDEPWFVGKDVCRVLDIKNESHALGRLDDDERAEVAISDPSGTKYAIAISEPGVYRLCFTSRKPEAERFKRWLAHEVLPALRRSGRYELPAAPAPRLEPAAETALAKLNLIREARLLFGPERARGLWRQLGLPPVPEPPPGPREEARACLKRLLDATAQDTGPPIRRLIAAALDDEEHERLLLVAAGIRVYPDRDGFTVANFFPRLREIYRGTDWDEGHYVRVLRRLPGAQAAGTQRFANSQHRGTFLPAEVLDDQI